VKVGDLVRDVTNPASESPLLGLLGLIVALGPDTKFRAGRFYIVKWMGRYNGETSAVSENEVEVVSKSS